MPRIRLPVNTLVGKQLIVLADTLADARDSVTRLKAILDQITAGGTVQSNLETDPEALVGTGLGATVYTNVVSIKAALDGLATTLAQYDQG
jgi:hypothetical protein